LEEHGEPIREENPASETSEPQLDLESEESENERIESPQFLRVSLTI